jgi:hypothetical protein
MTDEDRELNEMLAAVGEQYFDEVHAEFAVDIKCATRGLSRAFQPHTRSQQPVVEQSLREVNA